MSGLAKWKIGRRCKVSWPKCYDKSILLIKKKWVYVGCAGVVCAPFFYLFSETILFLIEFVTCTPREIIMPFVNKIMKT